VDTSDGTVTMSTYFGGDGPRELLGFMVEMPAPCINRAHFHDVDQFQIFLPNAGTWYQRHDVKQLTVFYADAGVVYGPFGSHGPDPMRFLTLRPVPSQVTGFMPGARVLRVQRGHRNAECPVELPDVPPTGAVRERELIAPEPDGLACRLLAVGPDTSFELPDAAPTSAGRYVFVGSGSLDDGTAAGPLSLAWLPPGTAIAAPRAGHEGAAILVCDFPAPTTQT
jgi:hypothetical protein